MHTKNSTQSRDKKTDESNFVLLLNFEPSFTMLEKTLERFLLLNYFNLKQSPDIYSEIKNCINSIRQWTDNYKFCISLRLSMPVQKIKVGR